MYASKDAGMVLVSFLDNLLGESSFSMMTCDEFRRTTDIEPPAGFFLVLVLE
jgi:hypothetical protein